MSKPPWEPSERDRPFTPPPVGSALLPMGEAMVKQLLRRWGRYWNRGEEKTMRDKEGRYAFFGVIEGTLWKFYLIAKNKPRGDLLSAGLDVLQKASKERIPLLLYLFSADKVYIIRPTEVLDHPRTTVSLREGVRYYDFDIHLAKPFEGFLRELFGPALDEIG